MTFYPITLGLVSFINLFLALFVFTKNVQSEKNKSFAFFETCLAVWGSGMLIMTVAKDKETAMLGVTILHLGLLFSFSSFLNFVLAITDDQTNLNRKICFLAYLLGLFFNIIDKIPLLAVVSDVTITFGTYQPITGPSGPLFNLMFLSFMSYAILLLYKKYRKTDSFLEKNRLKYIFFGMVVVILSSLSNILLVMGIKIYPLAHLGLTIYALMVTYSIVKYRLMDITIIIQKGLIYSLLTALVTAIWLLAIFTFEVLLHFETLSARILTIIIIILIFQPVREKIQLIVDKMFYRERHDLQELLKKVTGEISTIISRDTLMSSILNTINHTLHPVFVQLLLLEESERVYKPEFGLGENDKSIIIQQDEPIVAWFKNEKRELLQEEVRENPEFNGMRAVVTQAIERFKAIVSIPIIFKENLIGILNLGPKLSQTPYNQDELTFLTTLCNEVAVALENTKLYTDLQKETIKLQNLTQDLKIANKSKSAFLNIVSHELRTPLTVIMGYASLLSNKALGEITTEQEKSVKIMLDKCRHLNELIGDILDLSKIERGKKYELKKQPVDFRKIIEETVLIFTPSAREKQISIQTEVAPNIPVVWYDPEIAKEIFSKLVDNAIKFTPAMGKITIRFEDKDNYLQGCVEDTGIGIKPENLNKIFERFYQVDMSDTRKYEGTGLGLSIVKEVLEDSGGSIKVESQEDIGSKFIFTIPREEVPEEELPKIKLKGKIPSETKILMADEDYDNLKLAELYLKTNGYKIDIVQDGLEALKMLDKEKPNLVIVSLKLPKINGYNIVHILREHKETKDIPLIMLVPLAEEENLPTIYKAGATTHLFKPFDFKNLMEKVAEFC
ncbi:MAG: ATP-binding protein [bacterium]